MTYHKRGSYKEAKEIQAKKLILEGKKVADEEVAITINTIHHRLVDGEWVVTQKLEPLTK